MTVDALALSIHDRVVQGDLRGLAWRAWSADGRVTFMAAERITAGAPVGAPAILYAITLEGERETRSLWHHAGGDRWQRVDHSNKDEA